MDLTLICDLPTRETSSSAVNTLILLVSHLLGQLQHQWWLMGSHSKGPPCCSGTKIKLLTHYAIFYSFDGCRRGSKMSAGYVVSQSCHVTALWMHWNRLGLLLLHGMSLKSNAKFSGQILVYHGWSSYVWDTKCLNQIQEWEHGATRWKPKRKRFPSNEPGWACMCYD